MALSGLLDLLLPQRCLLCGQSDTEQPICTPCRRDLPWLGSACTRCALPLTTPSVCGRCLARPPSFDACLACFCYESPVDQLIGQFKKQRNVGTGLLLAEMLLSHIRDCAGSARPDAVVPVPLHWRRQLLRSFNQAQVIAEVLSRGLEVPLLQLAKRVTATPKQQQLSRRQRLGNLRQAFSVELPPAQPAWLAGRTIALVDDVVTTSATVEAVSAQLKRAGAKRVEVWALARTPAFG